MRIIGGKGLLREEKRQLWGWVESIIGTGFRDLGVSRYNKEEKQRKTPQIYKVSTFEKQRYVASSVVKSTIPGPQSKFRLSHIPVGG